MSTILKPFLLAVTLMLILIRPGFATEDGAITMVKTYSAYDYLQTRARLMHAVADHGLVLFGEFDHARAAQNVNLKCRRQRFWSLAILKAERLSCWRIPNWRWIYRFGCSLASKPMGERWSVIIPPKRCNVMVLMPQTYRL
ncbi:hypothetical protein NGUA11_04271 [Salmonella enterica]|nr:hypothetical protein NGUA11_04271 [Salmonella enterica]